MADPEQRLQSDGNSKSKSDAKLQDLQELKKKEAIGSFSPSNPSEPEPDISEAASIPDQGAFSFRLLWEWELLSQTTQETKHGTSSRSADSDLSDPSKVCEENNNDGKIDWDDE